MCVIQGKSMKRKLMTSSVIASLMLVAGAAVAADPVSVSGGTVHFEGELVNAACAVSTQSSDQVVTPVLPQLAIQRRKFRSQSC